MTNQAFTKPNLQVSLGKRIISGRTVIGSFSCETDTDIKSYISGLSEMEKQMVLDFAIEETLFILAKKSEKSTDTFDYEEDHKGFIVSHRSSGFHDGVQVPEEVKEYLNYSNHADLEGHITDNHIMPVVPILKLGSLESFVGDLQTTWPIRLYSYTILTKILTFGKIKDLSDHKKSDIRQIFTYWSDIAHHYLNDFDYLRYLFDDKDTKVITNFFDPDFLRDHFERGRLATDKKRFIYHSLWEATIENRGFIKRVFIRTSGPIANDFSHLDNITYHVICHKMLKKPIIDKVIDLLRLDILCLYVRKTKEMPVENYFVKEWLPEAEEIDKKGYHALNPDIEVAGETIHDYLEDHNIWFAMDDDHVNKILYKNVEESHYVDPIEETVYNDLSDPVKLAPKASVGAKVSDMQSFSFIEKLMDGHDVHSSSKTGEDEYQRRKKLTSGFKKAVKDKNLLVPWKDKSNFCFLNNLELDPEMRVGVVIECCSDYDSKDHLFDFL